MEALRSPRGCRERVQIPVKPLFYHRLLNIMQMYVDRLDATVERGKACGTEAANQSFVSFLLPSSFLLLLSSRCRQTIEERPTLT